MQISRIKVVESATMLALVDCQCSLVYSSIAEVSEALSVARSAAFKEFGGYDHHVTVSIRSLCRNLNEQIKLGFEITEQYKLELAAELGRLQILAQHYAKQSKE